MKQGIESDLQSALAMHQALLMDVALHAQLVDFAQSCLVALRAGGKIMFEGNGGSHQPATPATLAGIDSN